MKEAGAYKPRTSPYAFQGLGEEGLVTLVQVGARNTLDLNVVPLVRKISHLPVLVDPSHGVGARERVRPLARAAIAAGAHGLLIEVQTHPEAAYSDAQQTIGVETFRSIAQYGILAGPRAFVPGGK